MNDVILVVCSTENTVGAVAIQIPCCGKGCKKLVWLCDSTIKAIKEREQGIDLEKTPPLPTCIECWAKEYVGKKLEMVMPGTEQLKELANYIKNQK